MPSRQISFKSPAPAGLFLGHSADATSFLPPLYRPCVRGFEGVRKMRHTPHENAPAWSFLAGPDGRWLIENGPEFLAEMGDPNPDYDAPLFAVKNLGFIRVTRYGALIEITLHPAAVSPQAVDTVISTLSSMPARLFRIKHLQAEWQEELAPSAGCAAARLIELVCCWRGG